MFQPQFSLSPLLLLPLACPPHLHGSPCSLGGLSDFWYPIDTQNFRISVTEDLSSDPSTHIKICVTVCAWT